jgi:hypothetical protein
MMSYFDADERQTPLIHDWLTASLNALPAANLTVFAAAISIASPVAGFRPDRAARSPRPNVPKPMS